MTKKSVLGSILLSLLLVSCASKKNVLYFQDIENYANKKDIIENTIRIKNNDLLSITVSSVDRKSAAPFNLPILATPDSDATSVNSQQRLQTYLVDNNGNIQFPVLGQINLLGKTTSEASLFLIEKLKKYIKDPIVNLRVTNFKVSVLGEVRSPGVFEVTDERITLLEAISRAGDMTIFGKRKNVLVIREVDGKKTYNQVDFTSSKFFNSSYYYLQQNDVVVVAPNKAEIQSSTFNKNTPIYVSIAGVILTVLSILTR